MSTWFLARPVSAGGLVILATSACTAPAGRPFDPAKDLGIARFDSSAGCAALPRAGLAPGTSLAVLQVPVAGASESAVIGVAEAFASVGQGDPACRPELGSSEDHLYRVRLREPGPSLIGPVFAIVAPVQTVTVRGPLASVSLGPGSAPGEFRVCTSNEGVHLTLWRGVPLKGPRLFHAYYPLGYDVEPSCTEAEWAPP